MLQERKEQEKVDALEELRAVQRKRENEWQSKAMAELDQKWQAHVAEIQDAQRQRENQREAQWQAHHEGALVSRF